MGGLGFLFASGLRAESQAHRLVGVGARWTQGSHLLFPPIHEFMKIETLTLVSSSQFERRDEGIYKTRLEDTQPITTDPNFEQQVIKDSRGRDAFAGTKPINEKGAEQGGTLIVMP